MRASFERSELLRLLGPAVKVVESRNTIPILNNILLSVTPSDDGITDGTVSVTGTDLDIRIRSTGPAKVATAGTVTIDARQFEGIVRKLGSDVSVEAEGTTLIVKSGRSRFKLPTLPVEDFPDIAVGEFPSTFTMDVAALFKPVSYAISKEETRYYLNGIYFHADGADIRAVATDGHKLALHTAALPEGASTLPGVIVPTKAVSLVPGGVISVSVSPTKVRFVADGVDVVSKVMDGTFPNYRRVIPTANDKVARCERAALSGAVDRVATIMADKGRATKFSFADGALVLNARHTDADAQDEIAVEFTSEPIDIGFNADYVNATLAAFSGPSIEIALNDPSTPAIFRDGGELLAIIMPLRV